MCKHIQSFAGPLIIVGIREVRCLGWWLKTTELSAPSLYDSFSKRFFKLTICYNINKFLYPSSKCTTWTCCALTFDYASCYCFKPPSLQIHTYQCCEVTGGRVVQKSKVEHSQNATVKVLSDWVSTVHMSDLSVWSIR